MQQFVYVITDPNGIHARPAGLLAKAAKAYQDTTITVEKDGEAAKVTQLMRLMGMGIRSGDKVVVRAEGASEKKAIAEMRVFFAENL